MPRRSRRAVLALTLAAPAPAARAQVAPGAPPFRLTETGRLRVVARQLGWTVLRDQGAPPGAAETGIVLIRAQRPVPPAARPGHLLAVLRNIRAYHFPALPAEEAVEGHASRLPAAATSARGISAQTREPVVVRALALYGPTRTIVAIAAAPVADWDGLATDVDAVLGGLRPG